MSTKFMNFLAMCWFLSVLICMVIEGSYFNTHNTMSIINDLIPITWFNIGGIVSIPCFNPNFFVGVFKLLTWDYSFYTGAWTIVRIFWTVILSPGAVWGLGSVFAYVFGNLLSRIIGL